MKKIAMLALIGAACAGAPAKPVIVRPNPVLGEVARLEAARDLADGRLVKLAQEGPVETRVRALHALGRVGGPEAGAALRAAFADHDEAVVIAAIEGLWFADDAQSGAELVRLATEGSPRMRAAAVRALGKIGGAPEEAALVAALADAEGQVRVAAGHAAGLYGRRKLATAALVAPLVADASSPDATVREAAAYGLSNHPAPDAAALSRLAGDAVPRIRAVALAGLARAGGGEIGLLTHALDDSSPWVRVEAARALSGPKSTVGMRARLAGWLAEHTSEDHAVIEAVERMIEHATEVAAGGMFTRLALAVGAERVHCLANAGLVRRGESLELLSGCGWDRPRLVGQAIVHGGGKPDERLPALLALWRDKDLRARAAAAEAAVGFLLTEPQAEEIVRGALAAPEAPVVGAAADAVGALGAKAPAWVIPAMIERAKDARARDAELFLTLLDALVALEAQAAVPLAAGAVGDANPAIRAAAARAYKALTGDDAPTAKPEAPAAPPVDLDAVLGRRPVLEVESNRGTFRIELDADVAPWGVATLVTLARRGFYDGVVWHRVVPDFVVQGGDPQGTGWGGAGFNVPAEPSPVAYVRGTVGIADAGKDTGGSQFFIMHAPEPRLDGRYTVVGRVSEADMLVVDQLHVGDRMLHVRVLP